MLRLVSLSSGADQCEIDEARAQLGTGINAAEERIGVGPPHVEIEPGFVGAAANEGAEEKIGCDVPIVADGAAIACGHIAGEAGGGALLAAAAESFAQKELPKRSFYNAAVEDGVGA